MPRKNTKPSPFAARRNNKRKPGLRRKHKQQPLRSASQLAALYKCERQAMYEHEKAPRKTRSGNERARARGTRKHQQRHDTLMQTADKPVLTGKLDSRDKRCFIATAVYGPDAWQTNALRHWRDMALMPYALGRALTATYYRLSPTIARRLETHPGVRAGLRRILDVLVRRVNRNLKEHKPWQN